MDDGRSTKLGAGNAQRRSIGTLKKGAQGKGPGTPRRLVRFMRQFRRTYDPPSMTVEQLLASLPKEFERWLKAPRDLRNAPGDEVYQSAAPL